MRVLVQLITLMILLLMLQACASTQVAQQLQSGKISFEDGNFKSAFHKLLPLASDGNAEAQYAIGYMYFYGYGTARDEESGLFWISKSAQHGYQPAIEALKTIKQNKISSEPTQQITAEQSDDSRSIMEESNKILHALAEKQLTQPSIEENPDALAQTFPPAKPESEAPSNVKPLKQLASSQSDFNEEHKKRYTLQLMGSYDLSDIKQIQDHLQIENTSYCARTKRHGRDWYVLAYGKYSAPYLAKLAIDDLPSNVRSMKPWVRELDNVDILT